MEGMIQCGRVTTARKCKIDRGVKCCTVRSASIKIKPTPQEPSKTDTIQSELVDEVYDSRKLKNYATTSQLIY